MVEMADRALGGVVDIPPLPPFVNAREMLADALPLLDAPSRVTPTDAAERYVRVETRGVWQGFDRDVTPYMVEPNDTSQSRLFKGGAFVGPSQSGKTMALITTGLHPVTCDPGPVLIIHMDRPSRDRWVEESLNPVIRNSPDLRDRLGQSRDDDTFSRKRFRGMRMMLGYPTPQWLSSAKYRLVCMTDFDHFPPELGVRKDAPEGSAFDMAQQRIKTFLSRGYVFAESTPAWPVTNPAWAPSADAPHELPPVRYGIVPLYNRGTRGRWYWECPDCAERYEPRFDRLHFDEKKSPMDAGEGAEMQCPHCGGLIGPQHRNEMNRAALRRHDGWLHEGCGSGELVALSDMRVRQTEIASWSLDGAAATFSSWSDLVARFIEASRQAKELDDDLALGRFWYTDVGKPYARRAADADQELSVDALKADRIKVERGVLPPWARFVTVSIDVQSTRFPVQITAWGVDGRRTVVDRFDLFIPPADESGTVPERSLSPAKYAADWDVLVELESRVWPVDGETYGLRAVGLVVDYQGEPGVSDNAEKFWMTRRKAGSAKRWFLSRGHGGFRQRDRVWHVAPERSNKDGGKGRNIRLLNMATDRLKDSVTAALTRPRDAVGCFLIPDFLEDHHLAEFCAEHRTEKGWEKKPGQKRNESLDLSVQAQALAEQKGLRRMSPENPWNWAILGEENPHCVLLAPTASEEAPVQPKKRKRRIGKMKL